MKTSNILIIILLTAVMLNSCIEEIEFDGEIADPLVVLNSFVTSDSLISVHLTKSKFFLSNQKNFDYINNAEVEVFVNRSFKEKLQYKQQGLYVGTYLPKSGDTIRLAVTTPNMNFVESTTIIPKASVILSVDTTMILKDMYEMYIDKDQSAKVYYYDCEFQVKFRDDGDSNNYYRFVVVKHQEVFHKGEITYEQRFYMYFELKGTYNQTGNNLVNLFDDGGFQSEQHLFTDELFNGKEFTLKFKDNFGVTEIPPGYEDAFYSDYIVRESLQINLQSISREMYLYLQSKKAAEDTFGNFFSEPVQIYNNITNGIGIFGAFTNNVFEYKLY